MHKRFIMARLHFKSLLACFPHSLPPGRLQLSLQIIGKTNTRCLSHNMRKVLDTISRSSWLAHQEFLPVICHQMKQDILVLQGHSPLRQTLAQRQVSPNPISHEARRQMLAKWWNGVGLDVVVLEEDPYWGVFIRPQEWWWQLELRISRLFVTIKI